MASLNELECTIKARSQRYDTDERTHPPVMNRTVQPRGFSRKPQSRFYRIRKKVLRGILWSLLSYFAIILIGLIPVNHGFKPSSSGVDVTFVSSAIHADIILPLQTPTVNWRDQFSANQFSGDTTTATHIAIGWGDRNFFIQTRSLSDVRILRLFQILFWPTRACLHVSMIQGNSSPNSSRTVNISQAQYKRLVSYIENSFRLNAAGQPMLIPQAAHSNNDAFFEARGAYHLFNTCNSWVGVGMQRAGIITGWFTPLPKTMLLYLPK